VLPLEKVTGSNPESWGFVHCGGSRAITPVDSLLNADVCHHSHLEASKTRSVAWIHLRNMSYGGECNTQTLYNACSGMLPAFSLHAYCIGKVGCSGSYHLTLDDVSTENADILGHFGMSPAEFLGRPWNLLDIFELREHKLFYKMSAYSTRDAVEWTKLCITLLSLPSAVIEKETFSSVIFLFVLNCRGFHRWE
jgi:hypothetical protein